MTRRYGYRHRKLRAQLVAQFQPGQPCPRCRRPINGPPFDLDHRDDGQGYLGLAHRYCNRAVGANHSNRLQRQRANSRKRTTSRDW